MNRDKDFRMSPRQDFRMNRNKDFRMSRHQDFRMNRNKDFRMNHKDFRIGFPDETATMISG